MIDYTSLSNEIKKENLALSDLSYEEGRSVKTPEAFIYTFILYWNHLYDTVFIEKDGYEVLHTSYSRNRSLGDVYNITKHYFPKVKLEAVANTLYHLANENKGIGTIWCYDILKQVFYSTSIRRFDTIQSYYHEIYNEDYYKDYYDDYYDDDDYYDEDNQSIQIYKTYGEVDEYHQLINDYLSNINYEKINKNLFNNIKEIHSYIIKDFEIKLDNYESAEKRAKMLNAYTSLKRFLWFNRSEKYKKFDGVLKY